MERLQVIEFEVRPNSTQTFEVVQSELEAWVAEKGMATLPTEIGKLSIVDGETRAPGGSQPIRITARKISTQSGTGLLLYTDQESSEEFRFITEISLVRDAAGIHLRVSSSRSSKSRLIRPAQPVDLFAPRFIAKLLQNTEIEMLANHTRVDGKYHVIYEIEEIPGLVSFLNKSNRLPVLVIDSVRKHRMEIAKNVATKLAGLVHVVCIPWVLGIREFNRRAPGFEIPIAGARLIWPGQGVWHPRYESSEIDDYVFQDVARKVRSASRISRFSDVYWDHLWSEFNLEQREAAELKLAQSIKDQVETGETVPKELLISKDHVIDDLRQQLRDAENARTEDARRHATELEEWIAEFEANGDGSEVVENSAQVSNDCADEVLRLKSKITWLTSRVDGAGGNSLSDDLDIRDAPGSLGNEFFDFLERFSDESIVFTDAVGKYWAKSAYRHEDKMREALIQLTYASMDWRESNGNLGSIPEDWFQTKHRLTYAGTDVPLVRKKLDRFDYEGKTYSRVPHIKLGDASDRSNIGRIYFAWDESNLRIIVDSIGSHLYGDGKN